MVIRFADGTSTAIDYREKAPKAAHAKMYLDESGKLIKDLNHKSYLAIGVPGTVAGFSLALEKYGTMSLKDVIKPAIKLAEKGFPVSYAFHRDLVANKERFEKYPASAKKFLKKDGSPFQPDEIFKQKDLAETLKRISKKGRDGFYKGKTAELIFLPISSLLERIMPPRGPRNVLWVVVVTKSATGTGLLWRPAATRPA